MAFWIPLAIAAASSVGSNILHSQAAKKVAKEQALRENLELERQDAMRAQAQQKFQDLLAGQDRASQEDKIADETSRLADYYTGGLDRDQMLDLLPGQGNASRTVKTDIVRTGDNSFRKALKSGNARAALESYGGVQLGNDFDFRDAGLTLNALADQSRGSAAILPLELQAAQNKGASLRGWGNLLSTVGDVAGSIAMGNMFKSAMTPGIYGGESGLTTIGNKVITPSLDVYGLPEKFAGYGPPLPVKQSWSSLLGRG